MTKEKKIVRILVLNQKTYEEAKIDDTGFYTPECVRTFEDYVNYEISVLQDEEHTIKTVTPSLEEGFLTEVVIVHEYE